MQDSSGRACVATAAVVDKVIGKPGPNKLSEGFVYMTGSQTMSAPSLIHQFKFADLVEIHGGLGASIEGTKDAGRKEARGVAVEAVKSACMSQATEQNFSPLWAALKSVVDDLSQKCGPDDGCKVYFYTDLQEISEPWLCTQIQGPDSYGKRDGCPANAGRKAPKRLPSGADPELEWSSEVVVPPTQVNGIEIVVCGTNDSADGSAGKVSPMFAQRRDQAWQALFPGAKFTILGSCGQL